MEIEQNQGDFYLIPAPQTPIKVNLYLDFIDYSEPFHKFSRVTPSKSIWSLDAS